MVGRRRPPAARALHPRRGVRSAPRPASCYPPASERRRGATPSHHVLVMVPPGAGDSPVAPTTRIAGLPLLRRTVLAAARAGFEKILFHPAAVPEDPSLLAGIGAAPLASNGRGAPLLRSRVVLLATHVLPQVKWLRSLL